MEPRAETVHMLASGLNAPKTGRLGAPCLRWDVAVTTRDRFWLLGDQALHLGGPGPGRVQGAEAGVLELPSI